MARLGHRLLSAPILPLALMLVAAGCTIKRPITITTRPPDANVKINGIDRGKPPVAEEFLFKNKEQTHLVTVSRLGFQEESIPVKHDHKGDTLHVDLKPFTARITFNIAPVPAKVFVDGRQVGAETDSLTQQLEFTVDAQNRWTTHTLAVERKGFERLERVITWQDKQPVYNFRLEPQKKDLSVSTTPAGAQVFLNGEPLGSSPVAVRGREFPVDLTTDEAVPQKLRV